MADGFLVPSLLNLQAEQGVIGALMFSGDLIDRIGPLRAEHFSEPVYGAIFERATGLIRQGRSADPVILNSAMAADARLEQIGGLDHLSDLMGAAPPVFVAGDYAKTVVDLALRRAVIEQARALQDMANFDHDRPADEIAALGERMLSEAVDGAAQAPSLLTGGDAIAEALEHAEQFGSTPEFVSGLVDLDRMLSGFQRGELTILAGRPGMGKSIVGLAIAVNNALRGVGCSYFSLEMSARSLGLRLACDLSYRRGGFGRQSWGPTLKRLATNECHPEELAAVREAQKKVSAFPLRIDTRAGLTLAQIELSLRRQFREWRARGVTPGPVVIDHLGLVRPDRDRKGSKYAETADVSRGLAEMAKRLNVPVIALCQLNRSVESRDDKRPQLSDLREAGQLEEDARMVMLLHRPAYYFKTPPKETFEQEAERLTTEARERNLLRVIVAKNSNGPVGEAEAFVDVSRSVVRDRDAQP
jgi:replicative DNA helicase